MSSSKKSNTAISLKEGALANPMGLDGFEFIEFTAPNPSLYQALFEKMGFQMIAKHRSKAVTLFRQGDIHFIVNAEPVGHAANYAKKHGPSVCAFALRVQNAMQAYDRAVSLGACPFEGHTQKPDELHIPAIYGVGGSLIYFVNQRENETLYDIDFHFLNQNLAPETNGLTHIDHLMQNVLEGEIDKWTTFYERIFNFHEILYYDIQDKKTGLKSRTLKSPCGKIKIPLNQPKADHAHIEKFLKVYPDEGIQHIALHCNNIYDTVERWHQAKLPFLQIPESYYADLNARIPGHDEDLNRLKANQILMDGAPLDNDGLLLQCFTEKLIGSIFFEIIQRKGNESFGEDNLRALFEAIEHHESQHKAKNTEDK